MNSPSNGHFGARPTVQPISKVPCKYRLCGPREYIFNALMFPLSVVRKLEMSIIRVFLMYNYVYSEFRQDMKARPLFGRSPLFGVSVKREFTV